MTRKEPIAIVGIGCRFPGGADDVTSYWNLLAAGQDAISEIPADRWDVDALFDADPKRAGKTYARRGGFLEGIDRFDPAFFGISPREAMHVDPQQRLLLETAYRAMEDAGEVPEALSGTQTGVFVGLFIHDYQHIQLADREALGAYTGTGSAMSIAANRVSYAFDLQGPSLAVDTACSSSLVAIHLACQSLWRGESTAAVAGGVNVILKPEMTIAMSKASMLSVDGRCKAFDSRANGYVRAEGAGMIFLKPLSAAQRDRNPIYALIRGTAVNQDGRTPGISMPSQTAQQKLVRAALDDAGIAPAQVQYMEAHGTGTPVGDPIEANALGVVLSEGRSEDRPCVVGSVKTNIGHTESASGVAGLIKAALALQKRQIPQNLHFIEPNPKIDFVKLKLRVPQALEPWPDADGPRIAGVNSFGFGGTNAHVVLEEPPVADEQAMMPVVRTELLTLSARTPAALNALAGETQEALASGDLSLVDAVHTAAIRRSHHAHRLAVVGRSVAEMAERLGSFAAGQKPAGLVSGVETSPAVRPIFVFTGMGPQWWAMGRELLAEEPVFAAEIRRCDAALRALADWSLWDVLTADEASSRIQETRFAQPGIFAVQMGLHAVWRAWGIEPAGILGHSVGEIAAACASGALSFEDAVRVIYTRSRLQQQTAGTGRMLAVGLSAAVAEELVAGKGDQVSIAAINSPSSVTLSGDADALETIRQELDARGVFARLLEVEVPYHSVKMDPIEAELKTSLRALSPQAPRIPLYSTALGRRVTEPELDAEYWWRNVRHPVYFADALTVVLDDVDPASSPSFVEVGPHPVLATSIREVLASRGRNGTVVCSLHRRQPERATLLEALGSLYTGGAVVDWAAVCPDGTVARLPYYPWQRESYWAEAKELEEQRRGQRMLSVVAASGTPHPLLGRQLELARPVWDQRIDTKALPYLVDHRVQNDVVFPGAGFLEMVMNAAGAGAADEHCVIEDVELQRALMLPAGGSPVNLQTTLADKVFDVYSRPEGTAAWTRHITGKVRREPAVEAPARIDRAALAGRCPGEMASDYCYSLFEDVGLGYGPAFQAIEKLSYGRGEALARIRTPEHLVGELSSYLFHPALLDACLHTLFGALALNGEDADRRGETYLPVAIRQFRLYRRPAERMWSHAVMVKKRRNSFVADVCVFDEEGNLIAEVLDLRCQSLNPNRRAVEERAASWLYEYQWQAQAHVNSEARTPSGKGWLVFADEAAQALVDGLRARGHRCFQVVPGEGFLRRSPDLLCVDPERPEDVVELLGAIDPSGDGLAGVVHAWTVGSNGGPALSPASLEQVQGAGYLSVLHLVQALTRRAQPAPRLWVVTGGAQAVQASDSVEVAHAPLWGLCRVVGNEHPDLRCCAIDVSAGAAPEEVDAVIAELLAGSGEDEIALRGGQRFVHRLVRVDPSALVGAGVAAPGDTAFELEVRQPGNLDTLTFTRSLRRPLAAGTIEIAARAAALNFKDVMKATGLFPERLLEEALWSRSHLGMECAGIVERVGEGVVGWRPGDAVMALAPHSLRSHVVADARLVAPMGPLSFDAAAGVPMVFLTAHHALHRLARIRKGERVLIHAAAGGVGQAAVQLARLAGAEVFATAGSHEKRELLRGMGVSHVMDSRSLAFAEEIRTVTAGEGVDVVLNSLAGEAIEKSLSVLRDYGRFVEIGKMDIDRNLRIGLKPFHHNLSFFALDLDRLLAQRPDECGEELAEIAALFIEGSLKPPQYSQFPAARITEAFRDIAAARHVGKVVVSFDGGDAVPVSSSAAGATMDPNATYLVTGGLGGFGLQLAGWLVEGGARHLVLVGRSGAATQAARDAVASLERLGAEVCVVRADIGSETEVARVLATLNDGPPLKGIFHAAAILDDALLSQQDATRYRRVASAKMMGAWNLHQQTRHLDLDHFVLFSSVAAVLGNQGSGNYVAANTFVDALAHHRRSLGLPALSVNWGVIADVGMAADEDFYRQNLERNGLRTVFSRHGLELMGLLLEHGRTQTTVAPIDWQRWLKFNPAGATSRFAALARHGSAAPAVRTQRSAEVLLRRQVTDAAPEDRSGLVLAAMRQQLAETFRMSSEQLDVNAPLTSMGLDSLMAIEMKVQLEALGLAVTVTSLLSGATVVKLADELLSSYGVEAPGAGIQSAASDAAPAGDRIGEGPRWVVTPAPRPDAKVRLFCFSYAGGGPIVFHQWPEALPEEIEVCAIHLPGRGSRLAEPAMTRISDIADALVPALLPWLDRPFAFFGHCMGSIVMYEVACRLARDHGRVPVHFFPSGSMAPHMYNSPLVHEQDDVKFLEVLNLISFTTTRALAVDAEMRKLMFPLLRADFEAVARYGDTLEPRPALNVNMTGFAASEDLFAAPPAMDLWRTYCGRTFSMALLPGDHYFVESRRATVTHIIASRLAEHIGRSIEPVEEIVSDVRWPASGEPEGRDTTPALSASPALPRITVPRQPRTAPLSAPPLRLFCFPPAWGRDVLAPFSDPSGLDEIEAWAGEIELCAIELPEQGRGDEPGPESVDAVVEALVPVLTPHLDRPFALYGHCMGTLLMYETARRLRAEGLPQPVHIFASGAVGPHLFVAPNGHLLPDDKILDLFGVINHPLARSLREDAALRDRLMPRIRADLKLMASYVYRPEEPLECPITVLGSRLDLWSYPLRVDSWRAHTSSPSFTVLLHPGDHFYPEKDPRFVRDAIVQTLVPARPKAA